MFIVPYNENKWVSYGMKKQEKIFAKELPTDLGAVGKLLDDALSDFPNQFDTLLNSVAKGFKKFFSPPLIEKD